MVRSTCLLIGCFKAYAGCIWGVIRGVFGVYGLYILISTCIMGVHHRCKYGNKGVYRLNTGYIYNMMGSH